MKPKQTVQLSLLRGMVESGEARELRLRARLSLGEVAEAVGVSTSTIFRWENGQRRPHGAPALRYLKLLVETMACR